MSDAVGRCPKCGPTFVVEGRCPLCAAECEMFGIRQEEAQERAGLLFTRKASAEEIRRMYPDDEPAGFVTPPREKWGPVLEVLLVLAFFAGVAVAVVGLARSFNP